MKGRRQKGRALTPVLLAGSLSAILVIGLYVLDVLLSAKAKGHTQNPITRFLAFDPATMENALGNMAQMVVAVLGIVITVVSIVVQLAANRYTPRIAEMFFRDRKNLSVLGFYVLTSVAAVWVSLSVAHDFVPRGAIVGTLILVTLSLLLMIPYFSYVFDFLDPEKIISRIQAQALAAALSESRGPEALEERKGHALLLVEQLCDIAVNALCNKDKLIASAAVDALKDLVVSYLPVKAANPEGFFVIASTLRENPDFVAMDKDSIAALSKSRGWLEWKVLRQLAAVHKEALAELPDLCNLTAIDTRYIGEAALQVEDHEVLRLCLKFMNTNLRVTLNAGQVRTAYNLLHQYRQLVEQLIAYEQVELICDVASHLRYYAQVAQGLHLGFVAETVAYDLARLCEVAFVALSPAHKALLASLLSIDQAAETEAQETTLRGVRKAQVKLATFYLARGEEASARAIYQDMKDERKERLVSIRNELEALLVKDYWEVIDRGTNFDYLDEERKVHLERFFSWFSQIGST